MSTIRRACHPSKRANHLFGCSVHVISCYCVQGMVCWLASITRYRVSLSSYCVVGFDSYPTITRCADHFLVCSSIQRIIIVLCWPNSATFTTVTVFSPSKTKFNLGNIKSIIEVNLPSDMDTVYKSQKIGDLGLIMIVAGVVASLFAGCILDAVKKFKVSRLSWKRDVHLSFRFRPSHALHML